MYVGEIACRHGEIGRGTAQGAFDLAVRGFKTIECDATDDE
jgi:hypothetical protein